MIGVAIIAILLAVLMTVVGNLSDLSGNLAAIEEFDIVMQKVQNVLLTEETCGPAFNPIVGAATTYPGGERQLDEIAVMNTLGVTRIPLLRRNQNIIIEGTVQTETGGQVRGQSYAGKVRIADILLRPLVTLTPPPREFVRISPTATVEYQTYITQLVVRASYNGRPLPEQRIALKLYTELGSNEIRRCFSLPADRYESCWAFGGREVDGRCELPECSANTIANGSIPAAQTRPCRGAPCVRRNPGFFWIFRGGQGGQDSLPICVCLEDCSS